MTDSVSENICRMIRESERNGSHLTELIISDDAAKELAGELYGAQLAPFMSRGKIYLDLKSGRSKFMGRTITVST